MQDSNPLDSEQRTRSTYVKIAKEWSQQHDTQGFWNSELNYFQKILPQGKIFEIGCGGGRDAREFIQRGYSYFGTDVIPEFIEIAKRNVPEGEYEIQDVFHLQNYGKHFDGFWCSAVLLHVPKAKIHTALQSIKQNFSPGTIGFISLKEGTGERMEQRTADDARFFAYYNVDEFKKILEDNGFEVLHIMKNVMSKKVTWLGYFVKVK